MLPCLSTVWMTQLEQRSLAPAARPRAEMPQPSAGSGGSQTPRPSPSTLLSVYTTTTHHTQVGGANCPDESRRRSMIPESANTEANCDHATSISQNGRQLPPSQLGFAIDACPDGNARLSEHGTAARAPVFRQRHRVIVGPGLWVELPLGWTPDLLLRPDPEMSENAPEPTSQPQPVRRSVSSSCSYS